MNLKAPIEREYFTDRGFVRRLAWTSVRIILGTRARVAALAIVTAVLILATVLVPGNPPLIIAAALFLLWYAFLMLVGYLAAFVSAKRSIPVGSRYSATLGAEALVVGSPKATIEMPYSSYSRVRRVGDFVVLNFAALRTTTVLPAALLPDGDYDTLVEAVAGRDAPEPASDELRGSFDHLFVADASYPRRLAWAMNTWLWTGNPVGLVILALLVVLSVGVSLGSGDPLVGAILVLSFGLVLALAPFSLWRVYRRLAPAGTIYGVAFLESGLRIRAPLSRAQLEYSWFRSVQRRGSFVILRGRQVGGIIFLPEQLFPSPEIDRLAELIKNP